MFRGIGIFWVFLILPFITLIASSALMVHLAIIQHECTNQLPNSQPELVGEKFIFNLNENTYNCCVHTPKIVDGAYVDNTTCVALVKGGN